MAVIFLWEARIEKVQALGHLVSAGAGHAGFILGLRVYAAVRTRVVASVRLGAFAPSVRRQRLWRNEGGCEQLSGLDRAAFHGACGALSGFFLSPGFRRSLFYQRPSGDCRRGNWRRSEETKET